MAKGTGGRLPPKPAESPSIVQPPEWDVPAIFAAFGSADALLRDIIASGYPPPAPTAVWQWRSRGRIPAWWIPAMMVMLARRGHGTATRFIIPASPPPAGVPLPARARPRTPTPRAASRTRSHRPLEAG